MRSFNKLYKTVCAAALISAFAASAHAALIIDNSTVSILGTSSTAYTGYERSYALDAAALTDFAGNGTGNATHLDFDFGSALTFSQIVYTDRTSSGAANAVPFFGTYDYVSSYQYVFANDASFTDIVGTVSASYAVPGGTISLVDFQHTDAIPNITAQYLRWSVVSANGVNPGAQNFEFTAVPEPMTAGLFGLGLLGLAGMRRRSTRK
jgi:hypothetical protein